MCVKIVRTDDSLEFNASEPLELQIADAQEIVISYIPEDPQIDSFISEVERIVKNGISCKVDIRVNPNNDLGGLRLERQIESLKRKLDMNDIAKTLVLLYSEADRQLHDIRRLCLRKRE